MLPKIWKKLLLAICIIACLFNITSKLVNRISLEKVITSQKEGINVKELLNITDEQPVITQKATNTVSNYTNNSSTQININEVDDIENEEEEYIEEIEEQIEEVEEE